MPSSPFHRIGVFETDNRRPVEIHQLKLKPADFFTSNPALDMPTDRNNASVLVGCCEKPDGQA